MNDRKPLESGSQEPSDVKASPEESAVLARVTGGEWSKYARVAMAALSSLPWVGSVIGAAGTLSSESSGEGSYRAMYMWVKVHEEKLRELSQTLQQMFARFESFGDRVEERINSDQYMSLVRKTFAQWDHADSTNKKEMLRRLITNAGGIEMANDDLIRMFLDWTENYHDFHFAVIGEVYRNPGISRHDIWVNLRGAVPRDDSLDADLFKLLIRDLSTGGVIRQERQTDTYGHFVKQQSRPRGGASTSGIYETAFERAKGYVLTALGSQFVHYVMTDLATPLDSEKRS